MGRWCDFRLAWRFSRMRRELPRHQAQVAMGAVPPTRLTYALHPFAPITVCYSFFAPTGPLWAPNASEYVNRRKPPYRRFRHRTGTAPIANLENANSTDPWTGPTRRSVDRVLRKSSLYQQAGDSPAAAAWTEAPVRPERRLILRPDEVTYPTAVRGPWGGGGLDEC